MITTQEPISGPGDDVDTLLKLKLLLPPSFTNSWAKGIREIYLQYDCWNGLVCRKNSVLKVSFNGWGLKVGTADLAACFSVMENLESIYLDENPEGLHGDICDFVACPLLNTLSLARSSRIKGNLRSISSLVHLRALFLESTQVGGKFMDLNYCTNLMVISLSNTDVSGQIDVKCFPELKWLFLSNTRVSGRHKSKLQVSVNYFHLSKL